MQVHCEPPEELSTLCHRFSKSSELYWRDELQRIVLHLIASFSYSTFQCECVLLYQNMLCFVSLIYWFFNTEKSIAQWWWWPYREGSRLQLVCSKPVQSFHSFLSAHCVCELIACDTTTALLCSYGTLHPYRKHRMKDKRRKDQSLKEFLMKQDIKLFNNRNNWGSCGPWNIMSWLLHFWLTEFCLICLVFGGTY